MKLLPDFAPRRLAWLLLAAISACNYPGLAEPPVQATADIQPPQSAPTATLAAAPSPEPTRPEPTAVPTPTDIPSPDALRVAYVDGGDVWTVVEGGQPVQLTQRGDVSELRLSSDGELVAYAVHDAVFGHLLELRAIGSSGIGDREIADTAEFDALYPLDGLLHNTVSQWDFAPGSQTILLNTRGVFDGPGLVKNDDLLSLDTSTGELTPLLSPGNGGDFAIGPTGSRVSLMRPNSMGFVNIDGTGYVAHAVGFAMINTASEFAFYPLPVWSPDGGMVTVPIPDEEPFVPPQGGLIHTVPDTGFGADVVATVVGDVFRPQFGAPLVSPDSNVVAFLRPTDLPGTQDLMFYNLLTSDQMVYDTGRIEWFGWGPDSTHFFYSSSDAFSLVRGAIGYEPEPIGTGAGVQWVDAERYLYLAGDPGQWELTLGSLHEEPRTLAALSAQAPVPFDFAD